MIRSRVKMTLAVSLALGLTTLAACSQSSGAKHDAPGAGGPTKSAKAWNITFVPGVTTDPFYVTIKDGMEVEAKRLGVNVKFQGPAQYDQTLQIPVMDSVLASKPDLLIMTPDNAQALVPSVKKFNSAGIPVFTIDGDLTDTEARLGFITTDNFDGGKLGAQWISENVKSGQVVYVGDQPGKTVFDQRQKGFEAGIADSDLDYIGPQYTNDQGDAMTNQLSAIIQRYPDLSAIFCAANSEAIAAATAVKNAGKTGKIKIIGFDADPTMVQLLKAGDIDAIIAQNAYQMGITAIDYAVDYLNGAKYQPTLTQFPPVVVTKETVSSPSTQTLLYAG